MSLSPLDVEFFMRPEVQKSLKMAKINQRENSLRKSIKSEKLIAALMKDDYTPIQFLVLVYLGFLDDIKAKNNEKQSILLSIIFKTKGFENLRKYLSDYSKFKTRDNLEILFDLFTELEMPQPLKKVQTDLSKLK